jgi:MFS family permease
MGMFSRSQLKKFQIQKSFKGKRWLFFMVIFLFLVFREFDRQLVNQITLDGIGLFNANPAVLDILIPLFTILSILFYFVWGYLFDKHDRRKLFGVVGFIWGTSSWLMGIAPTYDTFLVSKFVSDITLSSYSGIFSLVGDYFKPKNRGKILGLLLIAYPSSIFLGAYLIPSLLDLFTWRTLLLFMGAIGFLFSILLYRFIISPGRGNQEPALKGVQIQGLYVFDWALAKSVLIQKSLITIYIIGFLNFIPWTLLTNWALSYITSESINTDVSRQLNLFIGSTLVTMSLGFLISGYLGDILFSRNKSGRINVAIVGILSSIFALILVYIFRLNANMRLLMPLISLGFFLPFVWPNISAAIMDVTLPELRGSASAIFFVFQMIGSLLSPIFVRLLFGEIGLIGSTTWVCVGAWVMSLVLLFILKSYLPKDIEELRRHMAYRSQLESNLQKSRHK